MRRRGSSFLSAWSLALLLAGCGGAPTAGPQVDGVTPAPPTAPPAEIPAQATQQAAAAPTEIARANCGSPTSADQEGPYYLAGAPLVSQIAPPDLPGQRLSLSGTVWSADCQPLADALVEIWQADSKGQYDFSDQYILRGEQKTDANGQYTFETILPGYYEPRPLHIHLKASHAAAQPLTTQIYFAGDSRSAGLPADLIVQTSQAGSTLKAVFNVVLAGK